MDIMICEKLPAAQREASPAREQPGTPTILKRMSSLRLSRDDTVRVSGNEAVESRTAFVPGATLQVPSRGRVSPPIPHDHGAVNNTGGESHMLPTPALHDSGDGQALRAIYREYEIFPPVEAQIQFAPRRLEFSFALRDPPPPPVPQPPRNSSPVLFLPRIQPRRYERAYRRPSNIDEGGYSEYLRRTRNRRMHSTNGNVQPIKKKKDPKGFKQKEKAWEEKRKEEEESGYNQDAIGLFGVETLKENPKNFKKHKPSKHDLVKKATSAPSASTSSDPAKEEATEEKKEHFGVRYAVVPDLAKGDLTFETLEDFILEKMWSKVPLNFEDGLVLKDLCLFFGHLEGFEAYLVICTLEGKQLFVRPIEFAHHLIPSYQFVIKNPRQYSVASTQRAQTNFVRVEVEVYERDEDGRIVVNKKGEPLITTEWREFFIPPYPMDLPDDPDLPGLRLPFSCSPYKNNGLFKPPTEKGPRRRAFRKGLYLKQKLDKFERQIWPSMLFRGKVHCACCFNPQNPRLRTLDDALDFFDEQWPDHEWEDEEVMDLKGECFNLGVCSRPYSFSGKTRPEASSFPHPNPPKVKKAFFLADLPAVRDQTKNVEHKLTQLEKDRVESREGSFPLIKIIRAGVEVLFSADAASEAEIYEYENPVLSYLYGDSESSERRPTPFRNTAITQDAAPIQIPVSLQKIKTFKTAFREARQTKGFFEALKYLDDQKKHQGTVLIEDKDHLNVDENIVLELLTTRTAPLSALPDPKVLAQRMERATASMTHINTDHKQFVAQDSNLLAALHATTYYNRKLVKSGHERKGFQREEPQG